MPSAWRATRLGEVPRCWHVAPLGVFVERVTYGFTNPMPTTKSGPYMLTAHDIHDGRIDYVTARHTSRGAYRSLTDKSRPRVNDVLLTKDGSIGRVAVCDRSDICINQSVALIRPNAKLSARFLKYLLETPYYQRRMESDSDGSTIKHIYITRVDKMEVAVPPLPEQQAVVAVLGTLDDKIDLNRKMNETLEQMARAIFKSWFVDFEPFRDKGMVESELGMIPKGWIVGTVGDVAVVIDCLHSKKPERQDAGKPFLQLWNIRDDGLIDMADTYYVSPDDYELWISRIEASPGDCVITNVGRVAAVAQIPRKLRAALGRNMTATRCKTDFQFPTFLLECLLSASMREEITRKMDTGTILDALNVKNIPLLRFALAPPDILREFEVACRPVRARMEENLAQSRTLAAIRDTLLPKLMSGEVMVSRIEDN